jgi:hypothetical protein
MHPTRLGSLAHIWGGDLHSPKDWRIRNLRLVRGDRDDGSVDVIVWELDAGG